MNARLCALLPYRYIPFSETVRTSSFDYAPDGTLTVTQKGRRRKKWGFGHEWDLVAHTPSGSTFFCPRCERTS